MKLFLVYCDLGYEGIVLEDCRIYYNRNSANSYRFRMQQMESKPVLNDCKWKIKVVYSHGRET